MNKKNLRLLAIGLVLLLAVSGIATFVIYSKGNKTPSLDLIRIACVGDSLTQSTEYPFDLWNLFGIENYTVDNFGAGSTTVLLNSETPYMNSTPFQSALDFQPNIVIIMLGTNDAQPNLAQFNASFVGDYVKLIAAFQALSSKPKIWIALPPPIFSNQSGKISPEYFKDIIIPDIKLVANQTHLPTIDVYSALVSYPNYFPDGEHPNSAGAKLIANVIYEAIISPNTSKVSP